MISLMPFFFLTYQLKTQIQQTQDISGYNYEAKV